MLTTTTNYNKICFFSLLRNIKIDRELLIDISSLFHTEVVDILKDLFMICNRHRASSSSHSCMGIPNVDPCGTPYNELFSHEIQL